MHSGLSFLLLTTLVVAIRVHTLVNGEDCGISNEQLQPSGCGESCREQTLTALRAMGELTNGTGGWWYDYNGNAVLDESWGECQPCNSSQGSFLPSYCCWSGVWCCQQHGSLRSSADCDPYSVTALQMQSANITAPFHELIPHAAVLHKFGLQYIDLSRNFITGSIPPSIGELRNLKALLLGSNNLTGTVPATLANLKQLQHLDLEFNFLSGSMQFLCSTTDNSLETLYLRANNFSGPLNLTKCLQLQIADVQENWFSGPLPVNGNNRNLIVLRARQNNFSGNLSVDVWRLPRLITLDLTNNSMSGELPQRASPSNQLNRLFLGGNNFSGSVPWGFADSSQLSDLDLGDNPWISGTLPNLEWMSGLVTFIIGNTRIHGTIPRELGRLPFLQTVDLHNTLMTCCSNEDEALQRAANGTLVPDFLVLDENNTQQPVIDMRVASRDAAFARYLGTGGNMTCPTVRRNRHGSFAFGSGVLRPANLSSQTWFVDPEYYWFQECACLEGFRPSKEHNISFQQLWCASGHHNHTSCVKMTVTTCSPRNYRDEPVLTRQQLAALIICGLAFCLLMIMLSSVTINMCIARTGKIRRQLDWWHKHLAGMPKSGKMSIVVTDIEGYSDLFKRCPELMYKALTLHNNVIRRCKYEHCGSTVQQEGDSYTLVFHEPFDAVAFCLQVQQALLDVNWPDGLMESDSSVGHGSSNNNNSTHSKHGRRGKFSHLEGMSTLLSGGPTSWLKKSKVQYNKQPGAAVSTDSMATLPPVASQPLTTSPTTTTAAAAAAGGTVSTFGSHMSRSRMLDLFRSNSNAAAAAAAAAAAVFNGLRVRMGVATGVVEVQSDHNSVSALANILNSALFKLAVDVSDAGNGGQILMESETFHRIKEELHPLGAVDSNGLNYNKLAQRTSLWHLLFLGSLCSRRRGEKLEVDEAVVLDMGEYVVPSLPPPAASMRLHAANATKRFLRLSTLMPSRRLDTAKGGRAQQHDSRYDAGGGDIEWLDRDSGGVVLPVKDAAAAVWTTKETSTVDAGLDAGQQTSLLPGSMRQHYFYHPAAAHTTTTSRGGGAVTTDNHQLLITSSASATPAAAATATKRPRVRLIQILPPTLVSRAPVWGNKLSLKDSWVCIDAPYFEAPGALEAPLGSSSPRRSLSLGKLIRSASGSSGPTAKQQQQQQFVQGSGVITAAAAVGESNKGLSVVNSPAESLSSSFSTSHHQQQIQQGGEMESLASQSSSTVTTAVDQQQQQQQQQPGRAFVNRSITNNPIPAVTMVFMCVEGAKVFGSRKKQLLKDVHGLLAELLIEALRHVPGGYLCRMQEGDLKYMVAFSSAAAALEWCLVVQEAAMYLNWPDTKWQKQKISHLSSEYDSSGGQLVFRGARLKMGVCEGVPRTIIPDHLGRADYHGASINQAARYMDAAAHGGQIACEAQLALAVLSQWQSPPPPPAAAATAAAAGDAQVDALSPSSSGVLDCVTRTRSAPVSDRSPAAGDGRHAAAAAAAGEGPAAAAAAVACDGAAAAAPDGVSSSTDDGSGSAAGPTVSPFVAAAGVSVDQAPVEPVKVVDTADTDLSSTPAAAASAVASDGASNHNLKTGFGARLNKLHLFKKGPAVGGTSGDTGASGTSGVLLRGGTQSETGVTSLVQQHSGTSGDMAQCEQQQQLPQGWEGLPANAAAQAAAVDHKPLFGLSDVPKVPSEVQIHHIGSFKFKGNPQPLDMVNVMLTSLAGRQRYFPADPPKGKGNRVAARSGLAAAAAAPLPTLAQQYRSHVPDHILRNEITVSQSFNDRHRLRSSSMPVQRSGRLFGLDVGNARGNAAAAAAAAGSVFSRLHSRRAADLLPSLPLSGPAVTRTISSDSQAAAAAAAGSTSTDTLISDADHRTRKVQQQQHGFSNSTSSSNGGSGRKQGLLPVFERSVSAVVGSRDSYPSNMEQTQTGEVLLTSSVRSGKDSGTWGDKHGTAAAAAAAGGSAASKVFEVSDTNSAEQMV